MNCLAQIYQLSPLFYATYPDPPYSELLYKETRPYNCLLLETKEDYFICVPYRTNMRHKYGYRFRSSLRSKKAQSGLDYTKMAIIKNSSFLQDATAVVDQDEYVETILHLEEIAEDANRYLDDYIGVQRGTVCLDVEEYNRRYSRSTLGYFHKELNLP